MEPTQLTTSIDALTRELEIITHNLANASSAGFKRRCNAFTKALDTQEGSPDTYSPGQIDLKTSLDFSQGSFTQTGNPLDFAIMGKGFFVVETPQGPLYTRNGSFQINNSGQLADTAGRIVSGESGPITVPPTVGISQIEVANDGKITANGVNIGKLQIIDFQENEDKLISAGTNCFVMPDTEVRPTPAETIVVKQGFQEASNVKVVDEMVDMIMVSRLYEANMRYLSAQKENSSSIMNVAMG
jgi:flagellar basal-body rod protein FlgF